MAMTVKKDNNEVRIQWRVADIKIPTSEIKNITQDQDIHAVPKLDSKDVSRIELNILVKRIALLSILKTTNTLFILKMIKKFTMN